MGDRENKLLLFELDEPLVIKTVEQVIVPDESEEEIVVQETVKVYPASCAESFGVPILSVASGSLLTQQHYSGDWDVFRPAKVIEEMDALSTYMLADLMQEAEEIMKRWGDILPSIAKHNIVVLCRLLSSRQSHYVALAEGV